MKSIVLVVLAACASPTTPPTAVSNVVTKTAAPPRIVHKPLKADRMMRGYFYAGGISTGLGGHATSDNTPRDLSTLTGFAPGNTVAIVARPDDAKPWHKYDGYRVVILNPTDKPVGFDAQDSRLGIVHEAIDKTGKWAAIEYLPKSWCGNSYHELELPAHSYWELAAPHYDGGFATKLRLKLTVNGRTMYSNEFDGRIDPRQFSEKQGHQATNIMDPYND